MGKLRGPVTLVLFTLLCLLIFQPVAQAQTDRGTITGTVKDPSGAAVPDVSIMIVNTGTNVPLKSVTDRSGLYSVPALLPGNYLVRASHSGFQTYVRSGITLQVNQVAVVDITLSLGSVSQSVRVSGQAPLLQTASSTLGTVIGSRGVAEMPLNSRNFSQLLTLSTGVTPISTYSANSSGSSQSARGASTVQVDGLYDLLNNYVLDGIDNNETSIGGIIIFPVIDAIQEFKVQTTASGASFGSSAGAQINVVLKSGTNQLHGDAWEFLRNSALDAKNYFDLKTQPIPPFRMNQFGFTLGGPIRKNRTFFFGDFQGSRIAQGLTYVLTVPTTQERAGDFSQLGKPIYDPATYNAATNTREQFPGNVIPASRLSLPSLRLSQVYYPLPSLPGLANNYVYNPVRPADTNQYDLKISHQLASNDSLFARYSYEGFTGGDPGFSAPIPVLPNSYFHNTTPLEIDPTRTKAYSIDLGETHLFSPRIVNEFHFGFTRYNEVSSNRLGNIPAAQLLGISGINNPQIPYTNGLPQIGISGYSGIGENEYRPILNLTNTFEYVDTLHYVVGKHSLLFGANIKRRQFNFDQPPAQRGVFSFNGVFTNNPASPAGTGDAYADFLLGVPASSNQGLKETGRTGQRATESGSYAADVYKLTRKLTLDMGLRYELTTPRIEIYDRQSNFDPQIAGGAWQIASPSATCGRRERCIDYRDFAPRLGLAYSINNKTVFRTSYGIFYDVLAIDRYQGTGFSLFQNPPFVESQTIINSSTEPTNLLQNGFPPIAAIPVVNGLVLPDAVPGVTLSGRFQEPFGGTPYYQEWDADLQREFTPTLMLDVAYVGNKGTHTLQDLAINQPYPGAGPIAPRQPYPDLGSIADESDSGVSNYNGLQAQLTKRYAHGLSFLISYTWSKALWNTFTFGGSAQNFYDRDADYGIADVDIPQRLSISHIWELPFGRGKKFLPNASAPLQKLVGGWSFSGIESFQSGEPFSVSLTTPVANTGSGSRADRVCGGMLSDPTPQRWFNLSCFTTPALYTYGDAANGILRGPGVNEFDWSLFKNTHITESKYLQFRVETFNIFNTPQLNLPNACVGSASCGIISAAGSPLIFQRTSREIQFALKFFW